ncbi:helix-turn-helix domain-containing protein [Sphingopyxis sp.]|jgi:excisionase family DNA binding protein|uniref:helix-turn-helix domain-containing protein n=1 Tax=Sphingopyxis sp. TaxID=1908224 RepID=UPI001D4BBC01|nr:helix-turn-helix domain-containing protein [Sphingopyxis sp.]MBW8294753.1 helix-turn-helix domain-containing protein [Sphingopyxis sp.]
MNDGVLNRPAEPPALSDDLIEGATRAASYIGTKPRTVYHLVEIGELPAMKKGKKLFFRKSELDAAFRSAA